MIYLARFCNPKVKLDKIFYHLVIPGLELIQQLNLSKSTC